LNRDDKGNTFKGKESQGNSPHNVQALRKALLPQENKHLLKLRLWQEQADAKLFLADCLIGMASCQTCLQKAYNNIALDGSQYYLGQELKKNYANNPPGGVSKAVGEAIDKMAEKLADKLHSKGVCKPAHPDQ